MTVDSGEIEMNQTEKLRKLLDIELPIFQAPMAGATTPELVAAVSNAGGLGCHGAAMLSVEQMTADAEKIRSLTNRSYMLSFFCHAAPGDTSAQEKAWMEKLAPYYKEFGVAQAPPTGTARNPFDERYCEAVLKIAPKIAHFHFGMPKPALVKRLKDAGIVVMATGTTVAECRQVVDEGADAVCAQGFEAGGHRGLFLAEDTYIDNQVGTMALVPQVVDAVKVPVIAAGGIADARGVAAAFALGASAAWVGTAYLLTPEAKVSALHRAALKNAKDDSTVLTSLFTGRPARGIVNRYIREMGAVNPEAPRFPNAANALAPLRAAAEKAGSTDFTPLWSGQAAALAHQCGAAELTKALAAGVPE
jgi:nitronate monooxygenase